MADQRDREKITGNKDTVVSVTNAVAPLDVSLVPVPGVVVDGFEIVSLLGEGDMCTVYKARHLLMDRPVALKMLHEKLVVDKGVMQRFLREAKAISVLEHPNIVKVYGFGAFGKVPFMAMEYLEGVSLSELLKQEQRLPKERALPIFSQILDALDHMHQKGIIHRDLKPSNVMLVGPENQVKLVDFGIAKILPQCGKELQKLTRSGDMFGTVLYMSPEQCSGAPMDARSDLYSMGCLMYEVLDGKPPLQGDAPHTTIVKQMYESPRASDYLADDFGSVVLAALEKDPAQRPQSAMELKTALSNPTSFARSHILREERRKSSVFRWTTVFGTLVVLGILVVLGTVAFVRFARYSSAQQQSKQKHEFQPKKNYDHDYELELARSEKILGCDSKEFADVLSDRAGELFGNGKYTEAEQLYKRSLAIREKALNPGVWIVDKNLKWLKDCYDKQGKNAAAEPLLKRSLEIRESASWATQQDVYEALNNLAGCLELQKKWAQAEPLRERQLAKSKEVFGPDHPDALLFLAENLYSQSKYEEAALCYRQGLAIRKKALKPDDKEASTGDLPVIACLLRGLACCDYKQGKYAEAEPLYKRSLQIMEKVLGQKHPELATLLENYAKLLRKTNRETEAANLEARAQAIRAVQK